MAFVDDKQPPADDKFGKTRSRGDTPNSTTQSDIKKQNADLKKVTSSQDQHNP